MYTSFFPSPTITNTVQIGLESSFFGLTQLRSWISLQLTYSDQWRLSSFIISSLHRFIQTNSMLLAICRHAIWLRRILIWGWCISNNCCSVLSFPNCIIIIIILNYCLIVVVVVVRVLGGPLFGAGLYILVALNCWSSVRMIENFPQSWNKFVRLIII